VIAGAILLLNVHALCEDKSDDIKNGFCVELGCVFDQFHRYDVKFLLGDCSAKVGREDIFKLTVRNKAHTKIIMMMELE
jgi:hypothetical protein